MRLGRKNSQTTPPDELRRARERAAEVKRQAELLELEYGLQSARDSPNGKPPNRYKETG